MNLNDTFAYIPLFSLAAVALTLLIVLVFVKKKSTARVSVITFFALAVIIATSVYAGARCMAKTGDALVILSLAILFDAIILLPYVIILSTFEPKKIEKLVPHSVNEASEKAAAQYQIVQAQTKALEVSEDDSEILNISNQFAEKTAESFGSENGMGGLLDFVNKTIREKINADGGAILMVDDFEDVITVKSFDGDFPPPYKLPSDMPHKPIRVATNFKFASFPLRENLFGEVATSGKAELITKPELDDRIYQNGPEEFLECGSYILIPMKVQDVVIGVAAFARTHANPVFTQEEFKTACTIADFAAASVKTVVSVKDVIEHNELMSEAKITSSIQQILHPTKLPVIKGIQIGTIWNPLEGVCGDYYDIIVSRKDRISFVMSDIAGKGINSIIVMAMIRAMVRLVVNTKKTAGTILEWVNHGISAESFSTDHFASCSLINFNPETRELELATGGTTPVYIYSNETNEIKRVSDTSEPIGVDKNSEYKDIIQKVNPGDILITYTDGLVESLNGMGNQYPKENILKIVTDNHKATAKDIANLVKADIKKFSGDEGQHDDQSMLVIKF